MGIYTDAIYGILMSYVVDLDLNNGKAQNGPQVFYENLQQILDEVDDTQKYLIDN